MNNENITLVTAQSAVTVILKPSINGYEKEHIDDAYLEKMTLQTDGEKGEASKIPAVQSRERMDRAIQTVVVSVDGSTDDTLKLVKSLDARDVEEIKMKIHEIIGDRKKAAGGAVPSQTSSTGA